MHAGQSSKNEGLNETEGFQPQQLESLKAQIVAYRLLSTNMPIPANLQHQLFGSLSEDSKAPAPSNEATKVQQAIQNPTMAGKIVQGAHLIQEGASASTQSFLGLSNAPSSLLQNYRLIIPSQAPSGIDPVSITKSREAIVKSRIEYRIKELEELPSNLPEEEKIKALIELKSLRLLHVQRKLRYEVVKGAEKALVYETALERSAYRRVKKLSLKDTRLAERLERQGRLEREKRDKLSQSSYMARVSNHFRDMMQFHKNNVTKVQKLNKAVLNFHSTLEKEEAKRQERMAKERIKALKNDDEEAYLKLVDQEKDTRITHLLRQTDSYLDSLTNLVALQQQEASKHDNLVTPTSAVLTSPTEDLETKKLNDYYATAHKVKETITEQSSLLVGGTLKDYQIKGLEWMVSLYNNHLNGILADEMGLGKTIQTISLVTFLMDKKRQNGPYLIIVPLSTMTNWSLEFQKWAPSIVKVDYKGTPQARKQLQYELKKSNFNVLLTTYEYIIKDKPFLSRFKWLYMIIDEGHRMKNSNSKLSTILTQYYSSKYRLILTGTPLQNNLPELWSILNFVLPKIFNSSQSFDEWFNTPFANTGEKIELNEEETLLIIKRLHKVLRPFLLRRLKKDVESELPDKVERIIKCRMSALQQSLHDMLKRKSANTGAGGGMRRLNNTIMQLRKICNHPFVFEEVERQINPKKENNSYLWRTAGKFELLRRILPKFKETGHKVLMFFQMTQIMTIMEDFLAMHGIMYLRLDGSTKAEDRTELLKLFNDPNSPYHVFLLSTRAGGLGLNLQTADTVIIFDSDWNPHQDLQAQDRAHRIGQTKEGKSNIII
jgi:ATP-dependent helicase STH1/SNF2